MSRFSDIFLELKIKSENGKSNKTLSKSKIVKCKYKSFIETFEIKSDEEVRYYHMNKGKYFLLSVKNILYETRDKLLYFSDLISTRLKELYGEVNFNTKFLILGLGNKDILADSLGCRVTKNVFITRNFRFETPDFPEVSVYDTNVLGVTGIESYDIARSVVNLVKPDIVILIDSLCASDVSRLGKSFQVSNIGLTPGAGINNARKHLHFKNVKMISIGVPLVVFAKTYVENWLDSALQNINSDNKDNLITDTIQKIRKHLNNFDFLTNVVTPKDIDEMVKNCAFVISSAINKSIFDSFEL